MFKKGKELPGLKSKRIGIYAGTFDPVHAGHITFALQAIEQGKLDEVMFLPERRPRFKQNVEHFGHRVAMLNRAVRPHAKLSVLELPDANFRVAKTLPRLRKLFPKADFAFLAGSDVLAHMSGWADVDRLLDSSELIIAVRGDESRDWIQQQINYLPTPPRASLIVTSMAPHVSSGIIRAAIRLNKQAEGGLLSVQRYAVRNWLYISVNKV